MLFNLKNLSLSVISPNIFVSSMNVTCWNRQFWLAANYIQILLTSDSATNKRRKWFELSTDTLSGCLSYMHSIGFWIILSWDQKKAWLKAVFVTDPVNSVELKISFSNYYLLPDYDKLFSRCFRFQIRLFCCSLVALLKSTKFGSV